MIVKSNSWHYKLYKNAYREINSTSLCVYFWKIVLSLVFIPLWLLSFLPKKIGFWEKGGGYMYGVNTINNLLSWLSVYSVLSALTFWLFEKGHPQHIMGFAMLFTFSVGAIVSLFIYIHGKYEDWKYEKREEGLKKQPSLVKEYIKSVKNKVCPIIVIEEN